jgi:hypothetical protein
MKKAKKNKSFVAHWGIGYRGKGSVSPKTFLKLVFSFVWPVKTVGTIKSLNFFSVRP